MKINEGINIRLMVFLLFNIIFISSCGGGGGSSNKNVAVSWDENKESGVNQSGGGYKVFYSTTSGFSVNDSDVVEVNVAYASGSTSPTSTTLNLSSGTYYILVAGYSNLTNGAIGTLSSQTSVVIP